ncbi:MAG TPA: mandelate racemase/muconate lactonizing enzyme family protein [Bryobacteraceae bacterium]|nr:mandelate racemase/muconate lactonizing enzyme family protein [Bryobacteraceae bacterium]
MTRRDFFRTALALPASASLAHYEALAAPALNQIKITDIKAVQVRDPGTLIKVETDAGISGIGPCGTSGPVARDVINVLHKGRLPHLGLIGKDPLAIRVHFHNMFYAFPQRGRQMRVLSGIDIALWDLAGKILNQPVSKLLGGNFREEIPLYSHCSGVASFLKKENWKRIVDSWTEDPRGYRAFKIDIHTAYGGNMQEVVPSLGPREIRIIQQGYANAREALGPEWEIIVHCHCELDAPTAIRVAEAIEPIKPLFFEDPLTERFSESWLALRRSTRVPLAVGENIELLEGALPFLQNQAVDFLQPDLLNSGGITGVKILADMAAHYRVPICLHNVSGHVLNMASQQFSAAHFNCPWMECQRNADRTKVAAENAPVIRNGRMKVSTLPGLGLVLDEGYLKSNLLPGETWWG